MLFSRRARVASVALGFCVVATPALSQTSLAQTDDSAKQAYDLGLKAFVWGYPAVRMEKTRELMTRVPVAVSPTLYKITNLVFAPVNQVANTWKPLGPEFSLIKSANSDTLYSAVWFDVRSQPIVLRVPNTKGRFYTFQFVDAWTNNFYYASQRTKGFARQEYALAMPSWRGALPKGVTRVDCPTPTGFVIGRFFLKNAADTAAVNALQRQVSVVPLEHYGQPYTPPRVKISPRKRYDGPLAFYERLGDSLVSNGVPERDTALLAAFSQIGITRRGFDASTLSDTQHAALAKAALDGEKLLADKAANMGREVHGWRMPPVLAEYFGSDYLFRAAIGYQAMFVNTPAEAYYPAVFQDSTGTALDGATGLNGATGRYTLTFAKGQTPPVDAFWSLTMYDAESRLMVENSIERYRLGSTDALQPNTDGSITLHIQADAPAAALRANWLPAPQAPFYMLLRMYLPRADVLSGKYEIPAVVQVE